MKKVRIAIQGSGIIARYHARACKAIPDVELVVAANWRLESLERFAQEWDIPRTTTSFAELAADREIDAVIVTVPNYLHKDETIRMLRAGKHVLVEKPMAMNASEAQQMVETAQTTGCLLMVGHMWRFDNEVGWLRNIIEQGMLGDIVRTKGYAIHPPGTGPKGWFNERDKAGGGLIKQFAIAITGVWLALRRVCKKSVYLRNKVVGRNHDCLSSMSRCIRTTAAHVGHPASSFFCNASLSSSALQHSADQRRPCSATSASARSARSFSLRQQSR